MIVSDCRRLNSRQFTDAVEPSFVKACDLAPFTILRSWKRQVECEHAIRIEARVNPPQQPEALDHQARSGHQSDREAHLCGHKQAAKILAARPGTRRPAPFVQSRLRISH